MRKIFSYLFVAALGALAYYGSQRIKKNLDDKELIDDDVVEKVAEQIQGFTKEVQNSTTDIIEEVKDNIEDELKSE